MKTKTCPRCSGTGRTGSRVLYLGVPGLCYQCDGIGTLQWMTGEEVKANKKKSLEANLVEIIELGTQTRTMLEEATARHAKTQANQLANGRIVQVSSYKMVYFQEELESYRRLYRKIRKELKDIETTKLRGKWVVAKFQPKEV